MTRTKKSRTAHLKNNVILCIRCSEQCIHAEKHVNEGDEPIECDTCQCWYHRKCLDKVITKKDWESLTGDNQNIIFKCLECLQGRGERVNELREIKALLETKFSECQQSIKNFEKDILTKVDQKIDDRINNINTNQNSIQEELTESAKANEERFNNIEKQLQSLQSKQKQNEDKPPPTQEKLENMIEGIKDTETNMERKIKNEVKMYLETEQDKEKRKNNLIIHRLDETQDNEKDQIKRDKADVVKILETTNPELTAEMNELLEKKEIKITRLGRRKKDAVKPRPVKIVFPDEDMKRDILSGCSNLKGSHFESISVQEDLSKEQQKKNYELREQVRESNKKNEKKVCVYRGEIIPVEDHPKYSENKDEN